MPRELPKTNEPDPDSEESDADAEFIQFRGRQTSVTVDEFGIRFATEHKSTPDGEPDLRVHKPLPVADIDDIRSGDAPGNAVAREVAAELVHGEISNHLICYGVACEYPTGDGEVCGEVFNSLEELNGHIGSHYGDNQ